MNFKADTNIQTTVSANPTTLNTYEFIIIYYLHSILLLREVFYNVINTNTIYPIFHETFPVTLWEFTPRYLLEVTKTMKTP
jgi:outer membrane receptor protein involved in Fe transport